MDAQEEKEKFEEGCDFFNGHEFFEAHESWEELWNNAEGHRVFYLQGLIQVAAALVHSQRENWNGVRKLFASALGYLDRGKETAALGEVDPDSLRELVLDFEIALQQKLKGEEVSLPYFELPRKSE